MWQKYNRSLRSFSRTVCKSKIKIADGNRLFGGVMQKKLLLGVAFFGAAAAVDAQESGGRVGLVSTGMRGP